MVFGRRQLLRAALGVAGLAAVAAALTALAAGSLAVQRLVFVGLAGIALRQPRLATAALPAAGCDVGGEGGSILLSPGPAGAALLSPIRIFALGDRAVDGADSQCAYQAQKEHTHDNLLSHVENLHRVLCQD